MRKELFRNVFNSLPFQSGASSASFYLTKIARDPI